MHNVVQLKRLGRLIARAHKILQIGEDSLNMTRAVLEFGNQLSKDPARLFVWETRQRKIAALLPITIQDTYSLVPRTR